MNEIDTIAEWLKNLDVVGVGLVFIFALWKQWIKFGWQCEETEKELSEVKAENKELRQTRIEMLREQIDNANDTKRIAEAYLEVRRKD